MIGIIFLLILISGFVVFSVKRLTELELKRFEILKKQQDILDKHEKALAQNKQALEYCLGKLDIITTKLFDIKLQMGRGGNKNYIK